MYKSIDYGKYFKILENMPIDSNRLYEELSGFFPDFCDNPDSLIEGMIALGAPIFRSEDRILDNGASIIFNKLGRIDIERCELCFVDIETTGANANRGQIIEIGAIKTRHCEVIDEFSTLVHSYFVPRDIESLTGIKVTMLEDAPKLKDALKRFAQFLGDSIFVAHNVAFDYGFISDSLKDIGEGPLLNARLCTLDLSRRAILSKRYALPYLNSTLGINNKVKHRAFADAQTSFELYKICSFALPGTIKSAQDLIAFSKGKISYPKYPSQII